MQNLATIRRQKRLKIVVVVKLADGKDQSDPNAMLTSVCCGAASDASLCLVSGANLTFSCHNSKRSSPIPFISDRTWLCLGSLRYWTAIAQPREQVCNLWRRCAFRHEMEPNNPCKVWTTSNISWIWNFAISKAKFSVVSGHSKDALFVQANQSNRNAKQKPSSVVAIIIPRNP